MKYEYHVIVIGAGSAGLVVASGCANAGAKVALVEKGKMGGDCLNVGCVPSKTLLKTAHIADYIRHAENKAINAHLNSIDIKDVMHRVRTVIKSIEPHDSRERYEGMGVEVFQDKATLLDKHTVRLSGGAAITGKFIVLATGSEPLVPPIPGLKNVTFYTNNNIFEMEKLPRHLIVLGAGPIGLELGQGFKYLGANVTVIDMIEHIFPKDDPEVAPLMERKLKKDNIKLMLNSKIKEVKGERNNISVIIEQNGKTVNIDGDAILVALGRVPSGSDMGLEQASVLRDQNGYVLTNDIMQTSAKNIYACGDIAGPYLFTHMAGYQGELVVKNIISPVQMKADYKSVPWAIYTKPEVAHVGYTEQDAVKEGVYHDKVLVNLSEIDRAKTEGEKIGFLKLVIDKKKIVIGATIVGEKASEMLPLAIIAVKSRLKASLFASIVFPYPVESEIYKFASYEILKKSFKPWIKKSIKKIAFR
jgi:pyruvate/2-oxoglutarate dehydrogenase complex dihydrolipoamide dehydrogenase (E3) component